MNSRKLIMGLAAALAVTIAPFGLSAGEDAKNVHRLFHVKVKPGHSPQFFEALAEHMQWRRENGETWTWWVHSVVSGPNHGDCIIRSGPIAWADVDAYEAFLEKGGVEFWNTCGEHIKDVDSWFGMKDERWVRWLPEGKDVNLVQVVTYDLKPGMAETFSNAIQQYHDTIMAEDYPTYYVFDWNLAGGDGNTVTLAILMESWADMQPAEETVQAMMARVLGEEEAKALGESFTSSYTSAQSSVVRYLDALSINQEAKE